MFVKLCSNSSCFFIKLLFVTNILQFLVIFTNSHSPQPPPREGYPLTSKRVQEGSCSSPLPANDVNLNLTWLAQPRFWYLPAGSRFSFSLYAEILKGRPANDIRELLIMCLSNPVTAGGVSSINGFGAIFRQQCGLDPKDSETTLCTNKDGTHGVNTTALETERDRVVMTDNKHYALNVRCINGVYKDWQLCTTTPFLPSGNVLKNICLKLKQLGFNLEWAMKLPCISNSDGLDGMCNNRKNIKTLVASLKMC